MKQRLFSAILLLVIGFLPLQAEAQFWKKMFHKNKRQLKVDSTAIKAAIALKKHRPDPEFPPSIKKQRYRIDYIAPIRMDDIVNEDKTIDEKMLSKSQAFIEFYKGIKLAADSLNALHYELDVYVHDIQDSTLGVYSLIQSGELSNSDLLLVALPAKDIMPLAEFGKNHTINVVSVYSPSDGGIANNPYFTMIQATLSTHCHRIKEALQKQYGKKKILLMYRDGQTFDKTTHELISENESELNFQNIACDQLPTRAVLNAFIDTTQKNIVLMPLMDVAYAEKLLKYLHENYTKASFEIWGMPSWKGLSNIHKKDAYGNLEICISQSFNFDHSTKAYKQIERQYKKEFGGKPGEWVFRGYESLYYFSGLLKKYGTIFNTGIRDNTLAIFTKFQIGYKRIHAQDPVAYNENQHVYIYKYKNGIVSLMP